VERFRDELQVDVRTIARIPEGEADPALFLPSTYRDMEELDGFLEHLAGEVHDPGYRALLESLLADDELRAQWRRAPCTRNGHHAYLGGLLEHTVAVATLAAETCQLHVRCNSDLLITAAIVHDGVLSVVGRGAVTILDGGHMVSNAHEAKRNLPILASGVELHVLPAGARFDMTTRTLIPDEARVIEEEVDELGPVADLAAAGRDLGKLARDIAAGDVSPTVLRRRRARRTQEAP
jgi:hypothetical protein